MVVVMVVVTVIITVTTLAVVATVMVLTTVVLVMVVMALARMEPLRLLLQLQHRQHLPSKTPGYNAGKKGLVEPLFYGVL